MQPKGVHGVTPGGDASSIGLVTIGQSPRPDLEREFTRLLGAERVKLIGALDRLSARELSRLTRGAFDYPLITRLRTGETVTVELSEIVPYVQHAVSHLARRGAVAAVILCSGDFPQFETPIPTLHPNQVLQDTVARLAPQGRIGVVAPLEAQRPKTHAKWEQLGYDVVSITASPYSPGEAQRAARAYMHENVDLIVLDCLGYVESFWQEFSQVLRQGAPRHAQSKVIFPQEVLAMEAERILNRDAAT